MILPAELLVSLEAALLLETSNLSQLDPSSSF
jgi:hypothetical protein